MADTLEQLADGIARADRVVALTGAGVSTASGIPDFRGPQGLWTRDPEAERLSDIDAYVADPAVRREAWRRRLDSDGGQRRPNAAHAALADLERLGRLDTLVTQNVDGLHQDAGSDPGRVVEIHGTARRATCLSCDWQAPVEEVLDRVRGGEDDPACRDCGGLLKTATVSFGQALDPAKLQRAQQAAVACDLLLAVGSSLTVYPVAALPQVALDAGRRLAVLNGEETPYDDRAHAVATGDVAELLPALVRAVRARC